MKTHVSIVPTDNLIVVDGISLSFPFTYPSNLHAIQWHDRMGHMEWTDDINHPLYGEAAYAAEVAPYVALWEKEQARITNKATADAARKEAEYNSTDARAARVRGMRDSRISATDYLMAADYPLPEEMRVLWTTYRQALRDITQQEGFPWQGGGADDKLCPWPVAPIQGKTHATIA